MQKRSNIIQNRAGKVIPGAQVLVKTVGGAQATIYGSDGGAQIFNPVETDSYGHYSYYAADGRYTEEVRKDGVLLATETDILLEDPVDGGLEQLVFQAAGPGSVTRTAQEKMRERVSVKDFGAIGDGTADDTSEIQAALNYASTTGASVFFPPGEYLISSGLIAKCNGDLPVAPSGSEIHFMKSNPVNLLSDGQVVLKAAASMSAMITYIFDTGDSDIAPFYSKIDGITFDGNSLAQDCVYLNYCMHMHIERCRMHNYTVAGIHTFGYGVAQYMHNVMKGPRCIYIEMGGDHIIQHNDMFPTTGGAAAIDCGYYSGNTLIKGNVITRDDAATGNIYGVRLSGDYAPSGAQEVRHIVIDANEFCGMTAGVFSQAFSTGARNVYQCAITNNHVTPFGSTNLGCLANLNSSEGIIIRGNWINKLGFSAGTSVFGLRLNNCIGVLVDGNIFQNLEQQAIQMVDCIRCKVTNNELTDIGKLGASYVVVGINGTSTYNEFRGNTLNQSSASYAQNGIYEFAGGDNNVGANNRFISVATPYFKSGANSWFYRVDYGSAQPTTGRYHKGDVQVNSAPAILGTAGSRYVLKEWVRLTDGVNHVANTDWAEARTLTGT